MGKGERVSAWCEHCVSVKEYSVVCTYINIDNLIPDENVSFRRSIRVSRMRIVTHVGVNHLHIFFVSFKKLPKWQPRSRCGQYLGISPSHSTTIGRILNSRTGFVSPQYHVVYDDQFSTVPNAESGGVFHDVPFDSNRWAELLHTAERYVTHEDVFPADPRTNLPVLHDDWLTPAEQQHRNAHHHQRQLRIPERTPSVMASEGEETAPVPEEPDPPGQAPEGAEPNQADDDDLSLVDNGNLLENALHEPEPQLEPQNAATTPETQTRSGRRVKRPNRLIESMVAQVNIPTEHYGS